MEPRETAVMWTPTGVVWITERYTSSRGSDPMQNISVAAEFVGYMRDVGTQDDPCYVACAKGDPGCFAVYGTPPAVGG